MTYFEEIHPKVIVGLYNSFSENNFLIKKFIFRKWLLRGYGHFGIDFVEIDHFEIEISGEKGQFAKKPLQKRDH